MPTLRQPRVYERHKARVANVSIGHSRRRCLDCSAGGLRSGAIRSCRQRRPQRPSRRAASQCRARVGSSRRAIVSSEWGRRSSPSSCKACEEQGGLLDPGQGADLQGAQDAGPARRRSRRSCRRCSATSSSRSIPKPARSASSTKSSAPRPQRDFWLKLDDLAHDICALLELIDAASATVAARRGERGTVFLAETTSDLREQRDAIRRDLQQQGYTVLPASPLPLVGGGGRAAVRADLARCRMSMHLLGRNYSLVPEGGLESLVEIQNELAIERGAAGLVRAPAVDSAGTEGRPTSASSRSSSGCGWIRGSRTGADLLETSLEDLRTRDRAHGSKPRREAGRRPADAAATAVGRSTST